MKTRRVDETMEVEKLARELWMKIESAQGFFFVSDGETFSSKAKYFERIRGRLKWGKEAVRLMEAHLKKHGQLKQD